MYLKCLKGKEKVKMKQQTQTNKIEWREVELGNKNYFKILGSNIKEFEGEKEYLSTESVKGTKIEKVECKIKYNNKPSRANMQPVLNSVWFAKMQSTLKVYTFTRDNEKEINKYILSTGFAGISLDKNISPDYVKFYFITNRFNLEKDKLCTGSTQRGVNNSFIINSFIIKIKIPLPFFNDKLYLKEQERIVLILKKAETLKQKGKNAEDLLDEYLKSVFYEMFYNKGFEEVELRKSVMNKNDFIDGPFGSNLKVSDQTSEGIRMIQINNIGVGGWRDKIKRYTTENKYLKLIRHSARNGDIVIAKMGEPLGRACFVPERIKRALVVADCMRLRVTNKDFDGKYLLFFLNTPYSKKQIENISHGSTRIRINLSMIKSIKIPLPPLPLQQKFARIVEHVEGLKDNVKKTKQNSEELFNSLMQKAFRGEL